MRRALGHYSQRGWGGARSAARRLEGTARTAGTLYDALGAVAARAGDRDTPIDPALLEGRSAREVMGAVVEAVRPVDGTQDAEASRDALRRALSEILKRFPDADLLNLTEEQRLLAVESYLSLDVFNRFNLDLGKLLQEKAPTPAAALDRLREVRDYIREVVSAAFRKLRAGLQAPTARRLREIARESLQRAFEVFEYAE